MTQGWACNPLEALIAPQSLTAQAMRRSQVADDITVIVTIQTLRSNRCTPPIPRSDRACVGRGVSGGVCRAGYVGRGGTGWSASLNWPPCEQAYLRPAFPMRDLATLNLAMIQTAYQIGCMAHPDRECRLFTVVWRTHF
jgi:hypothetical protein